MGADLGYNIGCRSVPLNLIACPHLHFLTFVLSSSHKSLKTNIEANPNSFIGLWSFH
jgi:hypothetical protein